MQRKKLYKLFGFFILGLAVAYVGGCYLMAKSYVSPIRMNPGVRPTFLQEGEVEFQGYNIPIWRGGNAKDVFLLVHGYGGRQAYWNPLADELQAYGEIVVVATMGQTVSPAPEVGFGVGEANEIIAVAEKLALKGKRVHLVGVSQGGAASWIAAGTRPELFKSITTEAAFCRLDLATSEFLSVNIPAGATLFKPIILFAERQTGISGSKVVPSDYAKKWQGASLILHSRDDGMFSERHATELAASANSEVVWFDGLKHAEIFVEQPRKVRELMMEMIEDVR